jgi:glycerol-3-phosphate acyltransferase PlsY
MVDLVGALVIAFAFASSYLFGAINPAVLLARLLRVDLRAVGSGNVGATNAGRALGVRWGIVVGVLDVLKGFIPALAFLFFFGRVPAEVAGFAAVLGHVSSPFLKGRGGKGVATTLGALLAVAPLLAVPVLAVFAIGVVILRRVGLAAMLGAVALAISGVGAWLLGWAAGSTAVFAVALALLVLVRHQRNLRAALRTQSRSGTVTTE